MRAAIDRLNAHEIHSVDPSTSQAPPAKSEDNHQPNSMNAVNTESDEYRKQFLHEATRLAIESVEKGWGGPFGAVIVKDGEIIGRGQNRVLLTGIPVYHAEVTAIIDACSRIKAPSIMKGILR